MSEREKLKHGFVIASAVAATITGIFIVFAYASKVMMLENDPSLMFASIAFSVVTLVLVKIAHHMGKELDMMKKEVVKHRLMITEFVFGGLGIVCLMLIFAAKVHMPEFKKFFVYASVGFSFISFASFNILRCIERNDKNEDNKLGGTAVLSKE